MPPAMLRSKKIEYRADTFLSYPTLAQVPASYSVASREHKCKEGMTKPTGRSGCKLARSGHKFPGILAGSWYHGTYIWRPFPGISGHAWEEQAKAILVQRSLRL